MSDTINKLIDSIYDRIMEMPNKVLDIFNDFFGEDKVDMQGFTKRDAFLKQVLYTRIYEILENYSDNTEEYKSFIPDVTLAHLIDLGKYDLFISKVLSSEDIIKLYKTAYNTASGDILVHFPTVKITNEYGKSTIINQLYVKVPININGEEYGTFTMNRSEYTLAELKSDYLHSHVSSIPINNFSNFQHCCLGQGPLNSTQAILNNRFNEDRWRLFCLELSKYVETESLAGIPYHRLENISTRSSAIQNIDNVRNVYYLSSNIYSKHEFEAILIAFLSYYLDNNNLVFSFRNGIYSIGMSFIDYLINISNSFIDWINSKALPIMSEDLKERLQTNLEYITIKCTRRGEELFTSRIIDDYERFKEFEGSFICVFKDRSVTLRITDTGAYTNNMMTLLNPELASYFLNKILITLNYRYGRKENPNTSGQIRFKV